MSKTALPVSAEYVCAAIERVVRPIVEGQIRGFLKEHPPIVEAVDWYKPRKDDKATTFINSLAKRIVRDLACGTTAARLVDALLELVAEAQPTIDRGMGNCGDGGQVGRCTDLAVLQALIERGIYRKEAA